MKLRDNSSRPELWTQKGPMMLGSSAAMAGVHAAVNRHAESDEAVLLIGEGGTGKELVARAIHRLSRRAEGPFEVVEGGTGGPAVQEADVLNFNLALWGDEAVAGLLQTGAGGTVFVEEIVGTGLSSQVRLLENLAEASPPRIDGSESTVRFIFATRFDTLAAVQAGLLSPDLYARLHPTALELPPLRDRGEDVQLLAEYFLTYYAHVHGRPRPELAGETAAVLVEYAWPGNIRELRHAMERAVVLADGGYVQPSQLILD